MEGKAAIALINLPNELVSGSWITGRIDLRNDGDEDYLALVLRTRWNDKLYYFLSAPRLISSGGTMMSVFSEGIIQMPNVEAIVDIYACHSVLTGSGGEFTIDGAEYKIDETQTWVVLIKPPPISLGTLMLIAGSFIAGGIGIAVAVRGAKGARKG